MVGQRTLDPLAQVRILVREPTHIHLKIKTSITLSEDLLQQVDRLAEQYGTRSALIERAIQEFVALGGPAQPGCS